ncbi:MAG: FecR family protein [Candidatus Sericytochromatia bacterium]
MKSSKKILNISLALLASGIISLDVFSKNENIDKEVFGKFTLINGNVYVIKDKTKIKVNKGSILNKKDKIISDKKSRAEITFFDKSKLRVNENSELILSPLSSKKDKLSFLKVLKGQVWASIINKGEGRFAIESKKSIFAVMGTTFDVNSTDKNTEMSVFDGSVGVTKSNDDNNTKDKIKDLKLEIDDNKNKAFDVHQIDKPVQVIEAPKQVSIEEWIEITKNQKITIEDNGNSTVSQIDKDDDWTKWNKDLDKKSSN